MIKQFVATQQRYINLIFLHKSISSNFSQKDRTLLQVYYLEHWSLDPLQIQHLAGLTLLELDNTDHSTPQVQHVTGLTSGHWVICSRNSSTARDKQGETDKSVNLPKQTALHLCIIQPVLCGVPTKAEIHKDTCMHTQQVSAELQ